LAYFAERLLGDAGLVVFPEIEGDPAFWDPSPEDVVVIQEAELIFVNGATYEKWLETTTLPGTRIVDTSAPVAERYITIEDAVSHSHGPGAEHAHTGTSFTTWLDLSIAVSQAESVRDGIQRIGLVESQQLERNFADLARDLEELDRALVELTSVGPSPVFIASHPVYHYLARRYDLDIESLFWEPDVYPDERQWSLLENLLVDRPAKWMIWEGTPLEQSIDRLEGLGVSSLVFDPAGNRPATGDFLSVMKGNAAELRRAWSP
jgi:zinc transport system substrate-binding protein